MRYSFAPAIPVLASAEQLQEWPCRLRNAEYALWFIYGRLHDVDPEIGQALEAYVNGAALSNRSHAKIWQLLRQAPAPLGRPAGEISGANRPGSEMDRPG